MRGVMKKMALSFQVLAAIIAVTTLQSCAVAEHPRLPCSTLWPIPKPAFTCPPYNGCTATVTITRTQEEDYMHYWQTGWGNWKPTAARSVQVTVRGGKTLVAYACEAGHWSGYKIQTYYCH